MVIISVNVKSYMDVYNLYIHIHKFVNFRILCIHFSLYTIKILYFFFSGLNNDSYSVLCDFI